MIGGQDYWKILERIGAHSAGELSAIEARKAERLILENAEVQLLAESYALMLTLLKTIGEESPEIPEAMIEHAVQRAVEEAERGSRKARSAKDASRRKAKRDARRED
jgi:hypothetical protein